MISIILMPKADGVVNNTDAEPLLGMCCKWPESGLVA